MGPRLSALFGQQPFFGFAAVPENTRGYFAVRVDLRSQNGCCVCFAILAHSATGLLQIGIRRMSRLDSGYDSRRLRENRMLFLNVSNRIFLKHVEQPSLIGENSLKLILVATCNGVDPGGPY